MISFSNLLIQNIDVYDKEKVKEFIQYIDVTVNQTYKLFENLLLW